MFISFEGIDGSGKSTQARLLAEALRAAGREVVLTREPGGSPGAEQVRRLLVVGGGDRWSPETELLLFNAARRDHLERLILPALGRGATVICDRFTDSTRVYQCARGVSRALVETLQAAVIGREPDRTLVIDLAPAAAAERLVRREAAGGAGAGATDTGAAPREDRFESLGGAFQDRLRDGFRGLAAEFPDRIRLIDGDGPAEAVAARVRAAL